MFTYTSQIFLHHTDAAGRLFFAQLFNLTHEAKEKFLESLGIPLSDLLNHPDYSFPLVHIEADYKSVLKTGDPIHIDVSIENIGETSIVFNYIVKTTNGILAATAKSVTVCVDKRTQQKMPIPGFLKDRL